MKTVYPTTNKVCGGLTKRYGLTDARTDAHTHRQRENSLPHHKQSLRGGINMQIFRYCNTCVKLLLQVDKTKTLITNSSLMKDWSRKKIAIRGDGKSPDQKVIDMQLQAANLVYIFDVIILSVTANKSGRLTVETSFLPLNSQASSYKVHSREITYKSSKGEQQFLNARHPLDLLYIYTIYYQNISKDIKVIERTSFPL